MRCPNCGQRLSDSVVICPSCGHAITEEDKNQQSREREEERLRAERAEAEQARQQFSQEAPGEPVHRKRGFFDVGLPETSPFFGKMKWFWFIIHIQLFLSVLSFLLNGYFYLTGSFYGEMSASLYEAYPPLNLLDKGYGIFALGMAVFAFYVRRKLRAFSQGAPRQLILYYVLCLAGTVVYILIEMIIVKQNLITSNLVFSIAVSVFMIFVNIYYFRNRRQLFQK